MDAMQLPFHFHLPIHLCLNYFHSLRSLIGSHVRPSTTTLRFHRTIPTLGLCNYNFLTQHVNFVHVILSCCRLVCVSLNLV